jgi:predicted DNA-binding transcriptional regulator YafY
MSKLERLYHLHNILSQRRTPVSRQVLMEEVGCSQATLYRLVADLRDHLGAPIEQDPDTRGYYYDRSLVGHFELPGIWLSPEELQALLSAREVLSRVQPGLLESELNDVQQRIGKLLAHKGLDEDDLGSRIRIIHQAGRLVDQDTFRAALDALLKRRRLTVQYHGRSRDEVSERTISPLRLTSYRNNWYLDAWCHLRQGLRSFALERLRDMRVLDEPAREMDDKQMNQHFASSYGIFSGPAEHWAVLRFSPTMARWVADELWHSRQAGEWLDDGHYQLRLPFGRSEELVMDLLRFGGDCEVLEPEFLREAVIAAHRRGLKLYSES